MIKAFLDLLDSLSGDIILTLLFLSIVAFFISVILAVPFTILQVLFEQ